MLTPKTWNKPKKGRRGQSFPCVRFGNTDTGAAQSVMTASRKEEAGSGFFYSLYLLTYRVIPLIIIKFLVFTAISSSLVLKGLWPGGFKLSRNILETSCGRIFRHILVIFAVWNQGKNKTILLSSLV